MRVIADSAWIDGNSVRGVALTLRDGRIAAVESVPAAGRGLHALPGFVNAHSHLELSGVRGEELAHDSFGAWVDALLAARARQDAPALDDAVRAGAAELLAGGTVAVGDVDPRGRSHAILRESALEGVVYRELMDATPGPTIDELERTLSAVPAAASEDGGVRLGVSPHAPYSTGEALYRRVLGWARRGRVPVASHVAETLEEEEFLERGAGPLAELFARRSFARPEWSATRGGAFRRVRSLAPPPGFVVIHGNHLAADEISECAAQRWPIVYCPRSHRYFGHTRHPAARVLAAGATLALGTDSRASNDGLDLWKEMACFRAADAGVTDGQILRAATAGGRRALQLEPAELVAGSPATFQLVAARDGTRLDPERLEAAAVRGELQTRFVFVRGRLVLGDPDRLSPA